MAAMTTDLTAFKAALAKGSGRAMILMREAKATSFTTALLEACWISPAYDRQCEADRAPYVARLVEASGEVADLFERILAGVEGWGESEEDILFPLRVLSHLVTADRALERSRLLAVLDGLDDEDRIYAAEPLIQLNGYPAFRDALTLIAPQWEDEAWRVEDWLTVLRRREGPGIDAVLEAGARTDALLAQALAGREPEPSRPRAEAEPFDRLRTGLREGIIRWGLLGPRPEAERRLLAEDLAGVEEAQRALPYLRFFARQPLPGDPKPLLRWRNDPDAKVRQFAWTALEKVDHWAVRALALEGLRALEPRSLGLLRANYRPGDYAAVAAVLDVEMTAHEAHGVGLDVLDFRDRLTADERQHALLKIYAKTPCSFCRADVVRALSEAGPLPDWLAEECRFDADPDTVALVSA
jgi:hypothetical protein